MTERTPAEQMVGKAVERARHSGCGTAGHMDICDAVDGLSAISSEVVVAVKEMPKKVVDELDARIAERVRALRPAVGPATVAAGVLSVTVPVCGLVGAWLLGGR